MINLTTASKVYMHYICFVLLDHPLYLPSTRLVIWLVSEVVSCRRRLVMKTEEPANNDVSVLEQASVAGRTPPRTRPGLNRLHSLPEPHLHTHKPREQ